MPPPIANTVRPWLDCSTNDLYRLQLRAYNATDCAFAITGVTGLETKIESPINFHGGWQVDIQKLSETQLPDGRCQVTGILLFKRLNDGSQLKIPLVVRLSLGPETTDLLREILSADATWGPMSPPSLR